MDRLYWTLAIFVFKVATCYFLIILRKNKMFLRAKPDQGERVWR